MTQNNLPEGGDQKHNLGALVVEKTEALDVNHTAQHAGDKMRSLETDSLPVMENRQLVGTVMNRNLDWQAAGQGHDPETERVGAMMSRELIFCYEDQNRAEAKLLMKERKLKYLPIVSRDMRIVGIVTEEDLAAAKGSPPAARQSVPGSTPE